MCVKRQQGAQGGPSCCLHAGPAFVSPRYRSVMGIVLFLGLLEAASIKSNLFRAICAGIVTPWLPPLVDQSCSGNKGKFDLGGLADSALTRKLHFPGKQETFSRLPISSKRCSLLIHRERVKLFLRKFNSIKLERRRQLMAWSLHQEEAPLFHETVNGLFIWECHLLFKHQICVVSNQSKWTTKCPKPLWLDTRIGLTNKCLSLKHSNGIKT